MLVAVSSYLAVIGSLVRNTILYASVRELSGGGALHDVQLRVSGTFKGASENGP